jgi:hypothetical protein
VTYILVAVHAQGLNLLDNSLVVLCYGSSITDFIAGRLDLVDKLLSLLADLVE